jgi:hypothetical protein
LNKLSIEDNTHFPQQPKHPARTRFIKNANFSRHPCSTIALPVWPYGKRPEGTRILSGSREDPPHPQSERMKPLGPFFWQLYTRSAFFAVFSIPSHILHKTQRPRSPRHCLSYCYSLQPVRVRYRQHGCYLKGLFTSVQC